MKHHNNANVNAEIAGLAKRHGIQVSTNEIEAFVASAGVRELQESELGQVAGAVGPTPEQCTKFFTFPSTTWTF
jgi:hypothetical protein